MEESGGNVMAVTDAEIVDAYRLLAAQEGIFCEPASAASIAGAIRRIESGELRPAERVVCVLTGHGLKDPDTAIASSEGVQRLPASVAAVERALFGG